ncbi:type II secretion system protein GspL [Cypionkella psychrotolerans]|uniref:type II secretion system protein GspL n=1 Tax=Cypionkella psychrotolerans TaxID=1678131 RepID=UPI00138F7BB5|nr:type II secretion system protein GspL [Cypionkella psychrotolerans]
MKKDSAPFLAPAVIAANTFAVAGVPRWIASEDVLLLNVTLPKMAATQRRAVVGFAVEELIAQPLDQVHIVLGPQLNDATNAGSWLVAVVSTTVMADLIAAMPDSAEAVLPDVLALQVPERGHWAVLAQQDRALVRMADGTGFAAATSMLPTLWKSAGAPGVMLLGGNLPTEVTVTSHGQLTPVIDPRLKGFDLRSGRFARRRAGLPKDARMLGIILAIAAIGHMTLLGLDVVGLNGILAAKEDAVRAAMQAHGQSVEGDVATALTSVLAAQQPASAGRLLPLLAQAFGALQPQTGTVQIKALRFSKADDSLALTMEAPDLAALQTAETAFSAVGLGVIAGAATSGDGAAEVQMTLRQGRP